MKMMMMTTTITIKALRHNFMIQTVIPSAQSFRLIRSLTVNRKTPVLQIYQMGDLLSFGRAKITISATHKTKVFLHNAMMQMALK